MGLISLLFQPWAVLVYAVLLATACRRPWLALPVALASLTTHLLKPLFAVPRPEDAMVFEPSYSFPSGHATAIAALACVLVLLWPRWWVAVLAIGLAALVGYSRLYLGVHRPVDILAGYAVGMTWVLGWFYGRKIFPAFRRFHSLNG
ncbi:phosphatase PAP2 family protein [Corynebacterium sp. H128]|uniref:phosphatase PAP2 family protein n=1 Tax=Corynebacterium sp. H128 TaxID=3133427 RepID=UPI0030B37B39